ncbi:hypothetical protein ACW9UR_09850 [Halovulum sp. GXIMD14794]
MAASGPWRSTKVFSQQVGFAAICFAALLSLLAVPLVSLTVFKLVGALVSIAVPPTAAESASQSDPNAAKSVLGLLATVGVLSPLLAWMYLPFGAVAAWIMARTGWFGWLSTTLVGFAMPMLHLDSMGKAGDGAFFPFLLFGGFGAMYAISLWCIAKLIHEIFSLD